MNNPVIKAFETASSVSSSMMIASVIIISIIFAAAGFRTRIARILLSATTTSFVLSIFFGAFNAMSWVSRLVHADSFEELAKANTFNLLFLGQFSFFNIGLSLLLGMSFYRVWRKRKKNNNPPNKMDYNF